MDAALRWTSADLAVFPENGKRYEIVKGELLVSRSPTYHHQFACVRLSRHLDSWSEETGLGEVNVGTGIIFADDDDVIPDVTWTSRARLDQIIGKDGHFHAAPDLVVEVLSPGSANARRDCETKLKLYSRRGVLEYWIVNWLVYDVTVFRRKGKVLRQVETLRAPDVLTSPLLPGFKCPVKSIFDSYATMGKNPPVNGDQD